MKKKTEEIISGKDLYLLKNMITDDDFCIKDKNWIWDGEIWCYNEDSELEPAILSFDGEVIVVVAYSALIDKGSNVNNEGEKNENCNR